MSGTFAVVLEDIQVYAIMCRLNAENVCSQIASVSYLRTRNVSSIEKCIAKCVDG